MRTYSPTDSLKVFCLTSIPFMFSLFWIIFGIVPINTTFFSSFHFSYIYICLFCWLLITPHIMTPFWVFLLGVLTDFLYGNPLGVSTVCFLLIAIITSSQHRFLNHRPESFLWLAFSLLILPILFIQWALASLLTFHLMPILPVFAETFVLIGFFPFIFYLCNFLYERYLEDLE